MKLGINICHVIGIAEKIFKVRGQRSRWRVSATVAEPCISTAWRPGSLVVYFIRPFQLQSRTCF